jgi:hypothetical protein
MGLLEDTLWKLVELLSDFRRVKVRVHKAFFLGINPPVEACFVNVVNMSRNREIEVTHVWFDATPQVPALPPQRPLPKRLKPDEPWETWVECSRLPADVQGSPFTRARVRLSTGQVVKSKENKDVPAAGWIPGS